MYDVWMDRLCTMCGYGCVCTMCGWLCTMCVDMVVYGVDRVMYDVWIWLCTMCGYGYVRCVDMVMYDVWMYDVWKWLCTMCGYGYVRCVDMVMYDVDRVMYGVDRAMWIWDGYWFIIFREKHEWPDVHGNVELLNSFNNQFVNNSFQCLWWAQDGAHCTAQVNFSLSFFNIELLR